MKSCIRVIAIVCLTISAVASAEDPHASCTWCHADARPATAWTAWASSPVPAPHTSDLSISALCLGCHDGTSATSIVTHDQSMTIMQGSHPTGIDYDAAALSNSKLRSAWSPSGIGSTIENDILVAGRVECVSCHNVHDSRERALLIKSNEGSALCLTCHDK